MVGAGVVGLSTALLLSERLGPSVSVTVIADRFSPFTNSDASGASLIPFNLGKEGEQEAQQRRWFVETFQHLQDLNCSRDARPAGISLVGGAVAFKEETPLPWWKDIVFGFRQVPWNSQEARALAIPPSYKSIWFFSTYMLTCKQYLPWLMARFKEKGGRVEKRRVGKLAELLKVYDAVINCSGLGARDLAGDSTVFPVRGATVVVQAPWVKQFFMDMSDLRYIFPRSDGVVLGGTKEESWSEEPDDKESSAIIQRCSELVPSLADAPVLFQRVGLRPVRPSVRMEVDRELGGVVHCYGHGGQGVVLHWGCAKDMVNLVHEHFAAALPAKL